MTLGIVKLLATCLMVVVNINAEIPDYIKICQRTDPEVDKCIINSIDKIRPKLVEGIPELNVPAIEPLNMKEIVLSRGPKGALLEATMSNVKVWGPSNFKILELKSDLRRNRFDYKFLLPHLHFEGNYKMDMQILLLNLHGKGDIIGNFTNYLCDVTMKGHKIMRDGEEYLEFDKMKIKLTVGDAQIHLSNLFNGDPVLGEATNRIINENSKVFIGEISPVLEKSLAELFTDISNKITLKFTYKELFP
ncbi:protein takeout-like [Arctopsyche grandis]|uniref:protein takeout-like n=1 Tax=Arctopsyche grandis TaxID=121162 RepID=UPI00406D6AA7